jgi:predicted dinucleotide-binding enzyme
MRYPLLAIALTFLTATGAVAETIAIIGTGDVANALGPRFAEQGFTIVYGSRDPSRDSVGELVARSGGDASATDPVAAAEAGDIVVLAVPGLLVEEIVSGLGDLDGKIVVDPTNPLRLVDGRFEHSAETSNTEAIQRVIPNSDVVKAFSTINVSTMIDPGSAGGPVTVPLAGNSTNAKRKVADIVSNMGLEPMDVGDARDARWVEGMLILWINNRYGDTGRPAFDYYLRRP